MLEKIKTFYKGLSTRTGIILLVVCLLLYAASAIQAFLPLDKSTKGILFVTFFGLAKVFQYSALAVLGVKGWQKFKTKLGIKRQETKETETTDTYTSKQQY